jgi:hypothetical protein
MDPYEEERRRMSNREAERLRKASAKAGNTDSGGGC